MLTDPLPLDGYVICVNLTTLDAECADDECILLKPDYDWIEPDHPTAVAFSLARKWKVELICDSLKDGLLKKSYPSHLPEPTFTKVREAAFRSRMLDNELKAFL